MRRSFRRHDLGPAQESIEAMRSWPLHTVENIVKIARHRKDPVAALVAMVTNLTSVIEKYWAAEPAYRARKAARAAQTPSPTSARPPKPAKVSTRPTHRTIRMPDPPLPNGGRALIPEIDPNLFDRRIAQHWWSGKGG